MENIINDKLYQHMTDYMVPEATKNITLSNSPIMNSGKYKKVFIYNTNKTTPLQKIWLHLPKVKILRNNQINLTTGQIFPLTVILGPRKGRINKFYSYVKKLEMNIKDLIRKLTSVKNMKCKSSTHASEGLPPLMNIKLPCEKVSEGCYELKFHIYNNYGKRVSVNNILQGTYAEAIIELTEVWFSAEELGFNWNILQLKLYPEFNFAQYLFNDKDDEPDPDVVNECYHCLYCPNAHVRTHFCSNSFSNNSMTSNIPPPPPPPPMLISSTPLYIQNSEDKKVSIKQPVQERKGFAISIDQILSVKLKPTKNKEELSEQPPTTTNNILEDLKKNLNPNKPI